jgi:cysteine desulfurase/selenocysteine lyase
MYGPTGIGVLYGKEKWLNQMPPYQGGGEMIKSVSFALTTYNELPFKFEAGTPNIEAAICLGAAVDYINSIGLDNIHQYEFALLEYAREKLSAIPGVRFIGTAQNKASVLAFIIENLHAFDIGTILDQLGIAVRTGHHCTQPLMDFYCIPGTVRASFAFYNTRDEVDAFIDGVKKAVNMLG